MKRPRQAVGESQQKSRTGGNGGNREEFGCDQGASISRSDVSNQSGFPKPLYLSGSGSDGQPCARDVKTWPFVTVSADKTVSVNGAAPVGALCSAGFSDSCLCRRLPAGCACKQFRPLRIRNPRHSPAAAGEVCATASQPAATLNGELCVIPLPRCYSLTAHRAVATGKPYLSNGRGGFSQGYVFLPRKSRQ